MKFVDLVKDARVHEHRILLWPRRWKLYDTSLTIGWSAVPFRPASKSSVPDAPGVYAFLIQPGIAANLEASYVMYVGMTDHSLRQRFAQYLIESKSPTGRPKVFMLLSLYRPYVRFFCSTVVPPNSPAAIENELLQAFIPPANERYPASITRVIKAFQ